MAADALADAIKRTYADTEGDVAVITSPPGNALLDERVTAFRGQIATKYGALNVVSEKTGDATKAAGYKIMLDLIDEYPELRGVFAADVSIAQGAAQAVGDASCLASSMNSIADPSEDGQAKSAVGKVFLLRLAVRRSNVSLLGPPFAHPPAFPPTHPDVNTSPRRRLSVNP